DRDRAYWQTDLDNFVRELAALQRAAGKQAELCAQQPRKFTPEEREVGKDDDARRICIKVKQWTELRAHYGDYIATVRRLMALKRDSFDPQKVKIEDQILKQSMGQRNSIHELQNYVVGIGKDGLVLNSDGSLNWDRTFVRINYLDLLHEQTRSEEHTSELQSPYDLVCRLLL